MLYLRGTNTDLCLIFLLEKKQEKYPGRLRTLLELLPYVPQWLSVQPVTVPEGQDYFTPLLPC